VRAFKELEQRTLDILEFRFFTSPFFMRVFSFFTAFNHLIFMYFYHQIFIFAFIVHLFNKKSTTRSFAKNARANAAVTTIL
jgi:hypothetical protein